MQKDKNNVKIKEAIPTTKTRINVIDNIKGILIFLVVLGHFLYSYSLRMPNSLENKIVNYLYCFHMPSFIFWSGFLSKSVNSRSFKSIMKLILIYIIFNFSHGFILYIYDNQKIIFFYAYHSYWYLLCLIYWRFSINYFSNQYFSITISFIISILIGYCPEIYSAFSIKRTFSFFPYFIVGYKLSKENFAKIISLSRRLYKYFLFIFFIFIYITLKVLPFIKVQHSMMMNNYKDFNNDMKIRIILFIFSFLMIIFSSLTIPNKNIWLLTKIGKNSLYIYLFHRIITIIIDKELFTQSKYSNNIILYSLLFSLLIIIIFGSDFFAKIINNFINMIYDYLFEMNIKGKICGFIFSIFFISILLLWRNDLLEAEKQKELELIKKSELSIKLI